MFNRGLPKVFFFVPEPTLANRRPKGRMLTPAEAKQFHDETQRDNAKQRMVKVSAKAHAIRRAALA